MFGLQWKIGAAVFWGAFPEYNELQRSGRVVTTVTGRRREHLVRRTDARRDARRDEAVRFQMSRKQRG